MNSDKYIDILNKLCNMFIDDGQVPEEVIEMLIDAGADVDTLKEIGFNDNQLRDYVYYASAISGQSEDEIAAELGL